jgi:hypothetical protein
MTEGAAVPVATKVALLRSNTVMVPERLMLTDPVTLTDGNAAGTAVIMFPSGIVTLAVNVASPPATLQFLMTSESGASTLSVSVAATAGVAVAEQTSGPILVFKFTVGPLYVLVDAMFVVAELTDAIVWLMEVVAVNWLPLSPVGSGPLTRLKVPVNV